MVLTPDPCCTAADTRDAMKLSPSASNHALYTHRVPTFMELHHAEFTPQFGESNKV